jgi:hypothetical protein
MKNLKEYFESTKGYGVLATTESSGKVDAAIYSRPHFVEEGTLAIIMRDRLTHHNLQSNDPEDQTLQIHRDNEEPKFLVYFTPDKELPLIGGQA